jgi:hypothetical protein
MVYVHLEDQQVGLADVDDVTTVAGDFIGKEL